MRRILCLVFIAAAAVSCKSPVPPPDPVVLPHVAVVALPSEYEPLPPAPEPPPRLNPEPPVTTPPELGVRFSSVYFNPDEGDYGIFLSAEGKSPITDWKVEIHEPQYPFLLFHEWKGIGQPPEKISWNGRNNRGELVQSASDYRLVFTATNELRKTGVAESKIEVDVLVAREGYVLKIQVPSIVFDSNSVNWDNLDAATAANNVYILWRVARILGKFNTYHVRVEGHANHMIDPDDRAAYQLEQTRDLQPLSEARAKTIVEHLVRLGISRARLSYTGVGGDHPVVKWEDEDNWWKNRRVEFILIK